MRRLGVLAAIAVVLMLPTGSAGAESTPTTPRVRVAKVVTTPKKHVRLVRQFAPAAKPSPSYVRSVIIPAEARRWNVREGWLADRTWCESRWRYWADNGQARGVGQFLNDTWARALQVWTRRVELRSSTSRLVRRKVRLVYDDGSENRVRGRLVRQRVTIYRRGLLPRWPSVFHGWANVRATARALGGVGRVGGGEWDCA